MEPDLRCLQDLYVKPTLGKQLSGWHEVDHEVHDESPPDFEVLGRLNKRAFSAAHTEAWRGWLEI